MATSRKSTLVMVVAWALVAPLTAQRQFDELRKRGLPQILGDATGVVAGDLDGDGDEDLVIGQAGAPPRLCLNDGHGAYSDATSARMPQIDPDQGSVALGDVDGDGDADLVVTHRLAQPRQTFLYLNDGTATFRDATAGRMPPDRSAYRLALADLDGDSDADLLLMDQSHNSWLLVNDGSGVFVERAGAVPVFSGHATSMAIGDIDGDLDADVVIGTPRQEVVLVNDGGGMFANETLTRMPAVYDATDAVALGDLDGDSDLDLVVGNSGDVWFDPDRVLLNDGTGHFVAAPAGSLPGRDDDTLSVAIGDLDADGDLDLVFGNGIQNEAPNVVYFGDGTGRFVDAGAPRVPPSFGATEGVALLDADRDGSTDIVFVNGIDFPHLAHHDQLLLNVGGGAFVDTTVGRVERSAARTWDVVVGDIDADGDADLLRTGPDRFGLHLNDGRGFYDAAPAGRVPVGFAGAWRLGLADVDADGDPDLLAAFPPGPRIGLALNDGAGTFTDVSATHLPSTVRSSDALAAGDVDGDGDQDLVIGGRLVNQLLLNDGTGRFADAGANRFTTGPPSARDVELGDVDGDGDLDVLVAADIGDGHLYLNDGTGAFVDVTATHMASAPFEATDVELADVDGDGDLDVLSAPSVHLYLNAGDGMFGTMILVATAPTATALGVGDFDADGDPDLVVGTSNGGTAVYRNDGGAGNPFSLADGTPPNFDNASAIELADVDADDDLDVIVADSQQGQDRIYLNLFRQLAVLQVPQVGGRYTLEVYARGQPLGSSTTAYPVLATRAASVALPPLGEIGIDLRVATMLAPILVDPTTGMGTLVLTVPPSPSLQGLTLFTQAAVVTQGVGAWLTNVTEDRIIP